MRHLLTLAALLPLALAPLPADAASKSTARVSGNITLLAGPGTRYAPVAKMRDGEAVHLDQCTQGSNWCLVLNPHGPDGWARGGDLVGWAAKIQVSPSDLFEDDPFNCMFSPHRPRHGNCPDF